MLMGGMVRASLAHLDNLSCILYIPSVTRSACPIAMPKDQSMLSARLKTVFHGTTTAGPCRGCRAAAML